MTEDLLRASLMCGLRTNGPAVHQMQLFYCVWRLIGRVTSIEALQRCIETGVNDHRHWIRPGPKKEGLYAITASGQRVARAKYPTQAVVLPASPPREASFIMESRNFSHAAIHIRNTGGKFHYRFDEVKVTGKRAAELMHQWTRGQLPRAGSAATRKVFNYGLDQGWHLQWDHPVPDAVPDAPVDQKGSALDPADLTNADKRRRVVASVLARQGQGKFREGLLAAYGEFCCFSGPSAAGALEAAHISPYATSGANDLRNGMLLRADIHNLFDLDLLRVDLETWQVRVHGELAGTPYQSLHGAPLRRPGQPRLHPSSRYFEDRYEWMGRWRQSSRRARRNWDSA